jgi:hypothetical protein
MKTRARILICSGIYYREGLRKENISEAIDMLKEKTLSLLETDGKS